MRIKKLELWNFKAFERFTMTLGTNAFLVGPNNAGKSTLIASARVAAGMLEHASRRKPTWHRRHGILQVNTPSLRADQYGLVTANWSTSGTAPNRPCIYARSRLTDLRTRSPRYSARATSWVIPSLSFSVSQTSSRFKWLSRETSCVVNMS